MSENKKRTRFDRNEFILYNDYAEIILYDRNQNPISKTKIDLEFVEKCKPHKWYLKESRNNKKYAQKRVGRVHLSHFVLGIKKKKRGWDVDHIDGDSLNNRKSNLRYVTHQENMMNQRVLPSNNTSGHMGVGFHSQNNNWIAQIKVNGERIHLGSFENIEDAIKCRKDAEIFYFGKNKVKNFE